jgi:CheY-like chemotaxis protein
MIPRRLWLCLPLVVAVWAALASPVYAQDEPKVDKQDEPKVDKNVEKQDEPKTDKGVDKQDDRKIDQNAEKRAVARKAATKQLMDKVEEEYRIYFREPKSALEHWVAMEYEMTVGKFDIAAFLLDKMLKLPAREADEELLRIEEVEGLRAFLRLKLVKQWSKNPDLDADARKNVEILVERVLAALERQLSDPERIGRFIAGLSDPVPEVRAFSLYQLKRSQHRAAPVLMDVLRNSKPADQAVLKRALLELEPEIMPAMLELYRGRDATDASDVAFRTNLLWLAKERGDARVIPYLWHLSAAKQYPAVVRDKAKEVLAYLLDTKVADLPPAYLALTQLAEQYFKYQVRWPEHTQVADREKPDKQIVVPAYRKWFVTPEGRLSPTPEVLKPDEARFDFGLRYARQAVELEPSYLPAQAVYLAFLLEAEFTRKPYSGQLDKLLTEKRPPALQRLLSKVDPELIAVAVDRAADEQNYAVLLPLIDSIGDRADLRLAQPSGTGAPGVLVKMLYYPDRRVQYAAARALLKLPSTQAPMASTRIVEILSRFLASDLTPKVLIVYGRGERATALRTAAKEAGYDADVAANVKDAVKLLHQSADYDAILLDDVVPANELPFALTQLRSDNEGGGLPLLLIASASREPEIKTASAGRRNTFVLPDVWATKGPELKKQLDDAIKFAAAPLPLRRAPKEQQSWLQYEVRRAKGQSVSEAEKKLFARESLDLFAQMARGELPGYDLRPAKDVLVTALNNDDTAMQALRILARFPASDAQKRLADIVLHPKKANLQLVAAQELNRHIQKNGLMLSSDQIKSLRDLEIQGDVTAPLRTELAVLVGTLRTTPVQSGSRLLNYTPDQEPTPKR